MCRCVKGQSLPLTVCKRGEILLPEWLLPPQFEAFTTIKKADAKHVAVTKGSHTNLTVCKCVAMLP